MHHSTDHPTPATELTVGQIAERSGVAVSALHFYERQGLINSRRTSGNQRRYRRDTLRRVAFIRVAQRVGMSLADIKAALDSLPEGRPPGKADWQRLSNSWRSELDHRIAQMEKLRDELTSCIGCGCLSLDTCTLFNPDDTLANEGSGPRRLLVGDATRP
jgi:MerR family redox-sensitive transcriptional activator SoxR